MRSPGDCSGLEELWHVERDGRRHRRKDVQERPEDGNGRLYGMSLSSMSKALTKIKFK